MAKFGGPWSSRPLQWKTAGTVATFDEGYGQVSVRLFVPGVEHRGWADLVVSTRDGYIGREGDVGVIRLCPADARRLRDELAKLVDDSEVQAFGGRV